MLLALIRLHCSSLCSKVNLLYMHIVQHLYLMQFGGEAERVAEGGGLGGLGSSFFTDTSFVLQQLPSGKGIVMRNEAKDYYLWLPRACCWCGPPPAGSAPFAAFDSHRAGSSVLAAV